MKSKAVVLLVCLGFLAALAQGQVIDRRIPLRKAPVGKGSLGPAMKGHRELQDGVTELVTVPPGEGIVYTEDQFYIEVSLWPESLWIELEAADVAQDFDFLIRYEIPVEFDEVTHAFTADSGSTSNLGYEEDLLWGADVLPGRYYICLVSYSQSGGDLRLKATIDGGFVDVSAGEEIDVRVPADPPRGPDDDPKLRYIFPDGQQFRFSIPAGAETIHVQFLSENLAHDSLIAYSISQPCTFDATFFLVSDVLVDSAGGFEEFCLTEQDFVSGLNDMYLWVFNDANSDEILTGTLRITVDGCAEPLAIGYAAEGIAPGSTSPGVLSVSSKHYRITASDPLSELRITVEGAEEPADLNLYGRKDAYVEVEATGVVADFRAEAEGTGPEICVITCTDVTYGDYYFVVATSELRPVPYNVTVEATGRCNVLFVRGDANSDGGVHISDAVAVLGYLFVGGDRPTCLNAADINGDGRVDVSDPIYLLLYLFVGGTSILPPYPGCGLDPAPPRPSCHSYPPCEGLVPPVVRKFPKCLKFR